MQRRNLLAIVFVFALLRSYGQASFGFVNVGIQSATVAINDTVKIGATLYNYGNMPFNDSLKFGLLHNGVDIANPGIFPRPYPGPPAIHLLPGDSIRLNFIIVVTSNNFIVGPTGVVIWPIAVNQPLQVHDSLVQPLNITFAAGIDGPAALDENQFQSVLINGTLRLTALGNPDLEQINLYNISGQQIFKNNTSLPLNIPVENLPAGIYVLQFRLNNGQQLSRKVFIPGSR